MSVERCILHVDMDAFFASLELNRRGLDDAALVVCMFSGRSEGSGAVSTSSYPARELGIHAGMPIARAQKLAEDVEQEVHFVPADKTYYEQVSERLRERVFEEYADRIEQASVDEAYLDVSERVESVAEAVGIAKELKEDIKELFELTCSVGVGPNKLVAKVASDREKPDGLTVVAPDEVEEFMHGLELEDIHGIGPKTIEKLEELDIASVEELQETDVAVLVREFGEKQGVWLQEAAHGRDESAVEESRSKQLSRLTTLQANSRDQDYLESYLEELVLELMERVEDEGARFRTVTLLVVDADIQMHSRSTSLKAAVQDESIVLEKGEKLLEEFLDGFDGEIRRIGIRVANLSFDSDQTSLDAF